MNGDYWRELVGPPSTNGGLTAQVGARRTSTPPTPALGASLDGLVTAGADYGDADTHEDDLEGLLGGAAQHSQ